MGRDPGDFLSAGSPKVMSHSTGGTLNPGMSSSRMRASITPQTAANPANKGTKGSQPTLSEISVDRVLRMLGHRDRSISGGLGRRPSSTLIGSMTGVSTLLNNSDASGMGRCQPWDLAMWNSVPNLTAVALSGRKLTHCVRISRSPGYLVCAVALHSFHSDSACSSWSVWVPAQCRAMPMLTHSSRVHSAGTASSACLISSHEASIEPSVAMVRSLSCASIPLHRSSRAWGMTGIRVQWPWPAQW